MSTESNTPAGASEIAATDRVALVIGATGLVGRALVRQLLDDAGCDQVRIFVRRSLDLDHPKRSEKLVEFQVDFDHVESFAEHLVGDVLFSALGTTLAKAGSKEAQWRVDHTYQFRVAEAAAQNGVPAYVLVSANGASESSPFFYSRMKGKLEQDVRQLPFESIRILRPGLLDGDRQEKRPGEKWALRLLRPLPKKGFGAKLSPISVETVARAARVAAEDWTAGIEICSPEQLFLLGEE